MPGAGVPTTNGGTDDRAARDLVQCLLDGRLLFRFAFQPVVDLKRGVITGYEALARFPKELQIGPSEVFQLAGRMGRRPQLEAIAAAQAMEMRPQLPANCFLTINAGPALLLSDLWTDVMSRTGGLEGVVIEITEDEPVEDYGLLKERLAEIRQQGGHVAVDDTGTGYASLKHVMELRPNFIKLDRFFVGGCNREPAQLAMIEMLGNIASRLDAWIVAEGVETAEELDELMKLGIPLAQGFYLGRPELEMVPFSEQKMETLRRRTMAMTANDLQRILEKCVTCVEELEAHTHLASDPSLQVVVLTDKWGRPVALVERHPVVGPRTMVEPMKVQIASDVREVLQRALTRSPESRFDPIVVTNELGRFEGIVSADRLMRMAMEPRNGPVEMEIVGGVVRPKRSGAERRAGWRAG